MRGTSFRVLITVLTLLLAGAGAAAADVSRYVGYGGPVGWPRCDSTTIAGPVDAGLLGGVDAVTYQNCQWVGGLTVEVDALLPWTMNATSPSAYVIDDIEIDFAGPGCAGTVAGSANAWYDSGLGVLTVLDQGTVITYLDPSNDCFGLVQVGEPVPVLADSYSIVLM
jgi:hypothetical protein